MKPIELLEKRVASAFYGRFPHLRPAQEEAIEPLVNGENIVLSSGTGSGKTEAVTAPLLSRFWKSAVETDSLTVIYIAPTKALVNDLNKRLQPILSVLGLRAGVRHGDRDDLKSGRAPHLLVTTPESLDVLLFRKDKSLETVKAVIIDEVHLLYNTQRGLQLSILLQRLKQIVPNELQWAALSATVADLSSVRDFLFGSQENARFLQHPAHRSIDAKVLKINDELSFLELIKKLIAGSPTKLLLFANSRKECDRLAGILNQDALIAPSVFAHYSSLSQEVRIETELNFSNSRTAVCLATSTLELGIDIGDIDAVLLWGVPGSVESFLQRIGRGNRRQNKTNVICLIPDQIVNTAGEALRFMTLIESAKKGILPNRQPYELFGAVAQQFLSVIASDNGRYTRVADLSKIIEHRKYIDRSKVDEILSALVRKEYLKPHGFKNQFGADEKLFQLQDYRMIYGNFPATSQIINVFYKSKLLGDVPAVNLLRIRRGDVLNFAGKRWKVQKTTVDGIFLEPSQSGTTTISFIHPGKGIGFDSFLAEKMWELLHSDNFSDTDLSKPLREVVNLTRNKLKSLCSFEQIPFIRSQQGICYFTFAGYVTNKAIALISKQAVFKANDISLLVSSPINWKAIPVKPSEYISVQHLLFEPSSEQSIYQTFLPSEMQIHEYLQDWLKDESVNQVLSRLSKSNLVNVSITEHDLLASI